jgi:hypothetical protein
MNKTVAVIGFGAIWLVLALLTGVDKSFLPLVISRAGISPKARQVRDEPSYSIDNIDQQRPYPGSSSTFGRGCSAECPIRFARFRLADDSV